jgi:hypothetical protein
MRLMLDPFRLLPISLAASLNQRRQDALDYHQEENRVLREQREAKAALQARLAPTLGRAVHS